MYGKLDIVSGLTDMENALTYRGKSAAAAASAIAAVYGAYFLWAARGNASASSLMAHMIGAVVAVAIVATALEIFIAIADRRGAAAGRRTDERDLLIGTRSARNGYYALLATMWAAPVLVLSGAPPALNANAILAMIVLAEIVNFGSRVVYDLRGA